MLCERCKTNQASVHTVGIINGLRQEHYLCKDCAQLGMQFSLPAFMGILSGMQARTEEQRDTACACGYTFSAFQKTGMLGCPKCYEAFADELLPIIKRAQGGRSCHVGSSVLEGEAVKPNTQGADERALIRAELDKAVKEERYERAAELRDRLRALEGGARA